MTARRRASVLITAVMAATFASPSWAAWRAVCREDVGRLCPPNQAPRAMLQCLREHRSELSGLCARRLPHPGTRAGANACAPDAARFCKDLAGRPAATQQCLAAHKSELSQACRRKLELASPAVTSAGLPCADDIERLCRDVPPDPGARNACLTSRKADVTPYCRQFIEAREAANAPCIKDVRRLCQSVPFGGGRINACLKEHTAELSEPCRQWMARMAQPKAQ